MTFSVAKKVITTVVGLAWPARADTT